MLRQQKHMRSFIPLTCFLEVLLSPWCCFEFLVFLDISLTKLAGPFNVAE